MLIKLSVGIEFFIQDKWFSVSFQMLHWYLHYVFFEHLHAMSTCKILFVFAKWKMILNKAHDVTISFSISLAWVSCSLKWHCHLCTNITKKRGENLSCVRMQWIITNGIWFQSKIWPLEINLKLNFVLNRKKLRQHASFFIMHKNLPSKCNNPVWNEVM